MMIVPNGKLIVFTVLLMAASTLCSGQIWTNKIRLQDIDALFPRKTTELNLLDALDKIPALNRQLIISEILPWGEVEKNPKINEEQFIELLKTAGIEIVGEKSTGGDPRWDYREAGPNAWPRLFRQCDGKQQSPIDIKSTEVTKDPSLKAFKFVNYDKVLTWSITYSAFSIVVTPEITNMKDVPYIEGSNFDEKFFVRQFHFHWGHSDYDGSEHTVDGQKFPLELHIVHGNNARNDKLTVLGFFFELTAQDNQDFSNLFKAISRVTFFNRKFSTQFALSSLLPDAESLSANGYFRYAGSLTVPKCSENVIWNVFLTFLPISPRQLNQAFHNNWPYPNYRLPQPLNGRKVTTNL